MSSLPITIIAFFIFIAVASQFSKSSYAIYRECTNGGSACAQACGLNQYADVTVNANGSYTCGCAGSCANKGTAGQSCGTNASGTCYSTPTGGSCNQGGVCGNMYCCSGSATGTNVTTTSTVGGNNSNNSSSNSNTGTTNNVAGSCNGGAGSFCNTTHNGFIKVASQPDSELMSCTANGAVAAPIQNCNYGCQVVNDPNQPDYCKSNADVKTQVPYSGVGGSNYSITCDHPDNPAPNQNGFKTKDLATGNTTQGFCNYFEYCTQNSGGAATCVPFGCIYNNTTHQQGTCASLNSSCIAGDDPAKACTTKGKCCQNGSASLPVLGTTTAKPADISLTAQMNFYSESTATNLIAQVKNNKPSQVLAAKTYTTTDKLNFDSNTDTSASYENTNFKMDTIPAGKYKVYMHVDRYLNKSVSDTAGNTTFTFPISTKLTTPTINLIPGDAAPLPHGDNYIDIQDYNYVLACIGLKINEKSSTCPDGAHADMDENGIINEKDLSIVRSHFGESGDSPFPPQFTCVTDPTCVSGNSTIQACTLKCSVTTPNQ